AGGQRRGAARMIQPHAKDSADPLGTIDHCWSTAVNLFSEIEKRHGTTVAKRLFRSLGSPSPRQRKKVQDAMLLSTYEIYGGNVQRFARYLAETNKKLPKERRFGPRGSTNVDTLRVYIRRVIRGA